MKTTKRTVQKKVRAWTVVKGGKICSAHAELEFNEGCGWPQTQALGIYDDLDAANDAASNEQRAKVVPCAITYQLPTKTAGKKRKGV